MRIEKPRSTSETSTSRRPARSGDSAAFRASLTPTAPSVAANTTSSATGVGSVAALMALQTVDDVQERRKRMERRGRQLLDGLDSLKLDVLENRNPTQTLVKLKSVLESAREDSGDAELDSLIDQIELRAEVELAKLARR